MATYGYDKKKGYYFYRSPVESVIDKKCPNAFVAVRFKDFDSEFTKYITQSKEEKEETARAGFNTKWFTMSDTEISSRVMNNWVKNNVLPEGVKDKDGWKKFTALELVWIEAVRSMRDFGLSLDDIARVRTWVMQWDKNNKDYPWFEYYVARALISHDDPYIVIFPKGVAELATINQIGALKLIEGSKHMLLISLKALLVQIGMSVTPALAMKEISSREMQVLRELGISNNKEVKVSLKNGSIEEIETEQVYPFLKDIKARNIEKQFRDRNEYGQIGTKFENGKPQSYLVKKRQRFKPV